MIADARTDAADLFEPGTEMAYFGDLGELPEFIDRYLDDEDAKRDIAAVARRRFLAEHTADRRMAGVVRRLREML